ncbi:MAG: hypothetical protein Q7S40_13895 [Opitutaceae bacterium]|nr:hypothetical protein [Opitutaceae bacterium]
MITADIEVAPPPATAVPATLRLGRFTLDGDDALERHLAQTCTRVLSGIRGLIPAAKLEAVLLGGGYGRGEGGVLRSAAGDRPYNDLEFYVGLEGNRHVNEFRFRRRLGVLGEILTHLADAEIEFKISSLAELRAQPVSMFSYDLVAGHRVLWCNALAAGLPGCDHHRFAASVPEAEGTRLLMNRCSGLLFARVELDRGPKALTPEKADFIRRNIAKVQLACGDALLTSFGRYHWSCRERHHRLEQLASSEPWPWLDAVIRHHRVGVDFKLHPVSSVAAHTVLAELHREVTALALQCWLAVESRRLGRAFPSAAAYAADPVNKCPGSPPLRNFLLNLRVQRFRFRSRPNPWRHPRQRIFHALALRLWEPGTLTDVTLRHQFERELAMEAGRGAEWLPAYRALWSRVQ